MIWFLTIYAMGYLLTANALENSFDYAFNPWVSWAAFFWPFFLLGLLLGEL